MRSHRSLTIIAGLLFITATGATMASQIIIEPVMQSADLSAQLVENRNLFVLSGLLEVTNALASAGIAIALFPILWLCAQGLSVAYLGLRLVEASVGVVTAATLLSLTSGAALPLAHALHTWGFLLVLIVFSTSTFVLYPLLFTFRLVPAALSLWGLIGGAMLLLSCLLIAFGRIEAGATMDTILSLPIWINEMVLALWLILRGVDLTHVAPEVETPAHA
ncbi:MAG: DUF4386 domain-containing protein [Paracoccaceae bacterium]|nr:DUF4386 domain-containing protein [Paracoccaceae bacterium]